MGCVQHIPTCIVLQYPDLGQSVLFSLLRYHVKSVSAVRKCSIPSAAPNSSSLHTLPLALLVICYTYCPFSKGLMFAA